LWQNAIKRVFSGVVDGNTLREDEGSFKGDDTISLNIYPSNIASTTY
jgi:hypothetical protein